MRRPGPDRFERGAEMMRTFGAPVGYMVEGSGWGEYTLDRGGGASRYVSYEYRACRRRIGGNTCGIGDRRGRRPARLGEARVLVRGAGAVRADAADDGSRAGLLLLCP